MKRCKHCSEDVQTPDDRTGLIHSDGRYACHLKISDTKEVRLDTVAEAE